MSRLLVESRLIKAPNSHQNQIIQKRSITPTNLVPVNNQRSPHKKLNKSTVIAPKFSPQQINNGVQQLNNILDRHVARAFRNFLMNVIELIKLDIERIKEAKQQYKLKSLQKVFSAWKNSFFKDVESCQSDYQHSIKNESSANEKIHQFLSISEQKQGDQKQGDQKLGEQKLKLLSSHKTELPRVISTPQSQQRSERTPKKTSPKPQMLNQKQTVKKPQNFKDVKKPQISTLIRDKSEHRHSSAEKYNTPQFKSITWDSDEDPTKGLKSIQYFKTNQMRKILFYWTKSTQQSQQRYKEYKRKRFGRVLKSWKKQCDMTQFKMFKAHHFNNFFVLRSVFSTLQIESNAINIQLNNLKKQRDIQILRKVIFSWELLLQKKKDRSIKIEQILEKKNMINKKRSFSQWKSITTKFHSHSSLKQNQALKKGPTHQRQQQFSSKQEKK